MDRLRTRSAPPPLRLLPTGPVQGAWLEGVVEHLSVTVVSALTKLNRFPNSKSLVRVP